MRSTFGLCDRRRESDGDPPAGRAAHVATRQVTFVDSKGRQIGRLNPEDFGPAAGERHVELAWGSLTSLLFELVRTRVNRRFGDVIVSLSDRPDAVDVDFLSGGRERFDLVVSCEGLHSTPRELVFGPERMFSRYLGYCFAICELPNTYGLRREAVIYNKPGKAAALYSTSDGPTLYGLFAHRRPPPSAEETADPQRQPISRSHWSYAERTIVVSAARGSANRQKHAAGSTLCARPRRASQ
jgi:2-polyprenyl-6-methoxyphenol hydroxylase-like FAD-dependent oxidoreductase